MLNKKIMSQIIPIYIPTYINNAEYAPARVLPRLLFYNGLVDCQSYYIESGSLSKSGVSKQQAAFPYFDNYNVVTGSFPTQDSDSLLFNNEQAAYGFEPTENLYTKYWSRYIDLLYNPYTRLLNCSAIIPLADYFNMELNDIVQFRGNLYHLRAINNYSLKNGTCDLQLLGPILNDVISAINPELSCDFDFSFAENLTPTTTLVPTTAVPTTTLTPTTATPTTTLVPTTLVPTTLVPTTLVPTTLTPTTIAPTTLAPTTTTLVPTTTVAPTTLVPTTIVPTTLTPTTTLVPTTTAVPCYTFTFTAGSGTQEAYYVLCGETATTYTNVTAGTPLVVCCYESGKGIGGVGSTITQGSSCSIPATTTLTPTVAPTTSTTTATPTTTIAPNCVVCGEYDIQVIGGAGNRGSVYYNDCITGDLRSLGIGSQVRRKFIGKNPYWVAGGGGGTLIGPTRVADAVMLTSGSISGSNCTPVSYTTCSLYPVTGSQSGGTAYFYSYTYVDSSGSVQYADDDYYDGTARVMTQGCYPAAALPNFSTITLSGSCNIPNNCFTTTTSTP